MIHFLFKVVSRNMVLVKNQIVSNTILFVDVLMIKNQENNYLLIRFVT